MKRISAALAVMLDNRLQLGILLARLRDELLGAASALSILRNEPFQIFVSQRRASLLVVDCEQVLALVSTWPLSVAGNTNWDVFFDGESKAWCWLNNGAWLRAAAAIVPWAPAGATEPSTSMQ